MGVLIAVLVMLLWAGHLVWMLGFFEPAWTDAAVYLHVLLQAYLYTGLFITAHDSMHGSITSRRWLNRLLGAAALWLFAAFSYNHMFTRHMTHHRSPGTAEDPDFSQNSQNPLIWFSRFFFRYVTLRQLATMAILFNVGVYILGIPLENLLLFWVAPAFLGTFQLFYFGTYRPHRLPHTQEMKPHNSRTQKKNHLLAMLSCYFFGYHFEHHEHPRVPWWRLYRTKSTGLLFPGSRNQEHDH